MDGIGGSSAKSDVSQKEKEKNTLLDYRESKQRNRKSTNPRYLIIELKLEELEDSEKSASRR